MKAILVSKEVGKRIRSLNHGYTDHPLYFCGTVVITEFVDASIYDGEDLPWEVYGISELIKIIENSYCKKEHND